MKLKYFQNKSDDTFEILLHGVIGKDFIGHDVAEEIKFLNTMGAKRIIERLNTVGGNIVHAFSIVSANIASEAEILTFNEGVADSAGSFVLASGTPGLRGGFDFSSVLLHDPSFKGEMLEDLQDDDPIKQQLMVLRDSIIHIIANNSGQQKEQVKALMKLEKRLTAQEAVDFGLMDFIKTSIKQPSFVEDMTSVEKMAACSAFSKKNVPLELETTYFLNQFSPDSSKTTENEGKWGDVNKRQLPREAFAQNTDDDPTEWKFPHHFVVNGKLSEETGRFTSGEFFLHTKGLNAAWSAANGARTGVMAPVDVLDHLREHREELGLGSQKAQTAVEEALESAENKEQRNNILIAYNKFKKMDKIKDFYDLDSVANEDAILKKAKKERASLVEAQNKTKDLEAGLKEATSKYENLEKEIEGYKDKAIESAVNSAIESGKIDESNKEALIDDAKNMGVDAFNRMVDRFKVPHANALDHLENNSGHDGKKDKEPKDVKEEKALAEEFDNLTKTDSAALQEIQIRDPKKFDRMLDAWNKYDIKK